MIAGYGSGPAAPAFGPKFTRLSKLVSALLAVLCALTLIYPGLRAYVTLVPGRYANDNVECHLMLVVEACT